MEDPGRPGVRHVGPHHRTRTGRRDSSRSPVSRSAPPTSTAHSKHLPTTSDPHSTLAPSASTGNGSTSSEPTSTKPNDGPTPQRAETTRRELDALISELRRAIGLSGRDRPQGSGSNAPASTSPATFAEQFAIEKSPHNSQPTSPFPSAPATTAHSPRAGRPHPLGDRPRTMSPGHGRLRPSGLCPAADRRRSRSVAIVGRGGNRRRRSVEWPARNGANPIGHRRPPLPPLGCGSRRPGRHCQADGVRAEAGVGAVVLTDDGGVEDDLEVRAVGVDVATARSASASPVT